MSHDAQPLARVFFADGTVAHTRFDRHEERVLAVLFASEEEARSADSLAIRDRVDRANEYGGGKPGDPRAVHTRYGTALVALSAAERVVVEVRDGSRAEWWTALAGRRGMILATNHVANEVYLKQGGLFRPHADPAARSLPVTGPDWSEVDFRDLDAEHVRPEGLAPSP